MVNKCLYCGSSSSQNNNKLSFHLFPKDQRKNVWLSILNLTSAGEWDRICSNHFKSQYYFVHGNKKKLVYDAVPTPDVFENEDENDSNQVQSPETPLYQLKRKLVSSSSVFPRKIVCSSRFGDLTDVDFSTPQRLKKNFEFVQATVSDLRQKNKSLSQKCYRLNRKICELNKIIKDQNDRLLQTNSAVDNCKTLFVVDEVSDIIKDSIEHSIGSQLYQQTMVNKWTDSVVENCLTRLCKLAKPFKYIVTCAIMQKNGAGFHAASSCYWDNLTDGSCTVRWENKTMYVIVSVFGLAI